MEPGSLGGGHGLVPEVQNHVLVVGRDPDGAMALGIWEGRARGELDFSELFHGFTYARSESGSGRGVTTRWILDTREVVYGKEWGCPPEKIQRRATAPNFNSGIPPK